MITDVGDEIRVCRQNLDRLHNCRRHDEVGAANGITKCRENLGRPLSLGHRDTRVRDGHGVTDGDPNDLVAVVLDGAVGIES